MKSFKLFFSAACVIGLCACSASVTGGHAKMSSVQKTEKIIADNKIGRGAARYDVETVWGEADNVSPAKDGGETAEYSYTKVSPNNFVVIPFVMFFANSANYKRIVLTYNYDKDGKVSSYSVYVNKGAFPPKLPQ